MHSSIECTEATPQHHTQKVATTDAILTCPMCFSPLCYSCQRHDTYPNQYRAMFVENCHVIRTERYKVAAHATPLKNRGKRKGTAVVEDEKEEEEKGTAALEAYFCVQCKTCKTHVAMMDDDEVYHFFNAIAQ
ncbi:E2F-associated phosphoprotein [Spinellus fusiger]|nr:E2F-associated phosphoprotein [Spinellus fusiger]